MLGKCKQPEKAFELFQTMVEEGCPVNHESYTALLSAYGRSTRFNQAFSLLEYMKNTPDLQPDVHTYTVLIKSCLHFSDFDKVEALLSDMEAQGIRPSTVTYNVLIDAYGKARKYSPNISSPYDILTLYFVVVSNMLNFSLFRSQHREKNGLVGLQDNDTFSIRQTLAIAHLG